MRDSTATNHGLGGLQLDRLVGLGHHRVQLTPDRFSRTSRHLAGALRDGQRESRQQHHLHHRDSHRLVVPLVESGPRHEEVIGVLSQSALGELVTPTTVAPAPAAAAAAAMVIELDPVALIARQTSPGANTLAVNCWDTPSAGASQERPLDRNLNAIV